MKDAYRRMSWCYLLKNDIDKFKIYRELSKRYGSSNSEEDKNIMREAELGITHDMVILKARLLFDGGYYQLAEDNIKQRSPDQLKTDYQKQEYHYRYARILHEQNKYNKAIDYYTYVVKSAPVNTTYYFAPYACLHMGYIYQKMGFGQIAKSHFSKVDLYTKAEYYEGIKVKSNKELLKLK
jgi:tetratricopeptide (TPR) repeat protein